MARDDHATRGRILDHAAALFAERGFKKVTVREICRAAHANVAAVNYHFGDKLGLYRRVIELAVDSMKQTNELSMAAGRGAAPEEQLRAYVRVFLTRMTTSGRQSLIHKLMRYEMEDPSEAFDVIIRDAIEPRHRYLTGIVSALSGWPPADGRVLRCVASLQGQCLIFVRPLPDRAPRRWRAMAKDIDAGVDHITAFTIGGIRAVATSLATERPT
jgi:AcrR family transcriptional regulator